MPTSPADDTLIPISHPSRRHERRRRMAAAAIAAVLLAGVLAFLLPRLAHGAEAEGGLYFRTERPGVMLEAPVVATDAEIAVAGGVARVRVRQSFVNPSGDWLEGIYVFPLPDGSAVDRMVLEIGERRIEGEIKERQEAQAIYDEAAANGQQASLLSGERPNIFTTSVANVGPGESVTVEIEYQDAAAFADGRYSLRFPMVVGPRYIPGDAAPSLVSTRPAGDGWAPDTDRMPDASRITPPVRHPATGLANPVSLAIRLDAGFVPEEVVSLYHPVTVTPEPDGSRTIRLAGGAAPAVRDFVLEWTPPAGAAPISAIFAEQRGGDTYLMVSLLPPGVATDAQRQPRDLVFIIDTSGSMAGDSMEQAKRALSLAIDRLSPGDRFNIIRFSDDASALFRAAQPWTADTLRHAQAWVAALDAEGGTNMMPALRLALAADAAPGRLQQVVFLTDGAVGNEAELFEDIGARIGGSRLFTIGIGSAPNSWFMRKAAELGRGTFTHIGDVTEVAQRTGELLRKLGQAVLTDIVTAWPATLAGAVEMLPAPVPDLYRGQPVTFTARLPGVGIGALTGPLGLEGRLAGGPWSETIDLSAARPAGGVAALWARARLAEIEDQLWRGGDPDSVRREATALALDYGLVSSHTSLVAVDRTVVRPAAEPLEHRPVPTNLPQGWQYDKVFGAAATGAAPALADPEAEPAFAPVIEMREVSLPGAMQTAMSLPRGATPAPLHLAVGLLLLAVAMVWTWFALGRRRSPASA